MSLKHLTDEQLIEYHTKLKEHVDRSSRFEFVKAKGFDCEFGYHLIRLPDEAEQILLTHDIDLQRAREPMKAIRRGEWTIDDVRAFFMEKEKSLEAAYVSCTLPDEPDEKALKELLVQCLEEHYGTLNAVFQQPDWATETLRTVDDLLNGVRQRLYGAQ